MKRSKTNDRKVHCRYVGLQELSGAMHIIYIYIDIDMIVGHKLR